MSANLSASPRFILDRAGVTWQAEDAEDKEGEAPRPASDKPLNTYSVEELEGLLDKALGEENYERAAEIRDEIQRRES